VVARQHAGTINLRYLAPPATVLAIAVGVVAGLVGLGGGVLGPWPALSWLALGFLVPAAYLAGILAVTATAARRLAGPALARLPVALVTMHLAWGFGFLTSPRRLRPGFARSRLRPPGTGAPERAGHPQSAWLSSQSTVRAAARPSSRLQNFAAKASYAAR
jgi:hypothetical protein